MDCLTIKHVGCNRLLNVQLRATPPNVIALIAPCGAYCTPVAYPGIPLTRPPMS
ncbi:MAG: hypothetical protein HY820_29530 [Acidobacteria bacterium]|nr:hypothetical protein [Acidobacteriota bacterium]